MMNAGLWPAAWLMGNLARATFEDTTMVMKMIRDAQLYCIFLKVWSC